MTVLESSAYAMISADNAPEIEIETTTADMRGFKLEG